MQTLSMTGVEHVQYDQTIDSINLGLANKYSKLEEKRGELIDKMFTESQEDWKEYLSNNTGDQLKTKGVLGRSSERISTIDFGQYLKKGSDKVNALTKATYKLSEEGAQAASQARAAQMDAFAKVAFVKNPDIAPPKPVYQSVGLAMFNDALSIGSSIASIGANMTTWTGSDRRLKENIQKIGESISGLGIYKFNYIGKAKQYIGTMADEVIKIVPEAVSTMDNGFLGVNYSLIDVTFKEV